MKTQPRQLSVPSDVLVPGREKSREGNHQRINAKCLVEMGACIYVEDKDLEPNKLREILNQLLSNPVKMNYLKQNTSHLAKFDATDRIVECIKSL